MAETTQVLGIVAIDNKGAYSADAYYEKLNVVTYQGSSYCAKTNVHNVLPTDTDYWQLVAEKGDKGDTGNTGDTGPAGYTPVKGTDYYTAADKAELESTLSSDVTAEVSTQLSDLTSATPLAAETAADMIDTTRIYVLVTDGHWYWYDGTDWQDGGVYQAAEDSDTVDKLRDTFDWENDYNLFNPSTVNLNCQINTDGTLQTGQGITTVVSDYINVSGFLYVVFNYMKPSQIAFYDESKVFIQRLGSSSSQLNEPYATLRSETQAGYIRICYNPNSSSYPYDKTLVYVTNNTSDTQRKYVPFNNIILKPEHINIPEVNSMWDTFDTSNVYNLFNPETVIEHSSIGGTTGTVVTNPEEQNVVSDVIDITGFNYIVFNYMKPTQFAFYDENKNFIDRPSGSDANINVAYATLRSATQAKYLRICYNPNSTSYPYNRAMVYGTNDSTDISRVYVPYNNIIMKPKHLPESYIRSFVNFEPNFYPTGIKQCAWRGIVYALNPNTNLVEEYATENSWPSYRKAVEEKMDFLWLAAIRWTSDNVFYIMHDATTGRTCTTDITVASSTSTQMDNVRLKQSGWNVWSDDDLKIPKFEEVIKFAYANNITLGIRLTLPENNSGTNKEIWDLFINMCRKYNLKNAIYSGSINQCNVIKSYEPNWFVQATGSSHNTEQQNLTLLDNIYANNYNRKGVIFYKQNLTENVINSAREKDIYVFGVADEPVIQTATLEQYKNLCIDAIITHTHIIM